MGKILSVIAALVVVIATTARAETNAPASDGENAWQLHVVQSYQALQQQQQAMQQTFDQARSQADATARRNADAVETRLKQLEQSLNVQRDREIESLQASHRFTLILVGTIAGAGFVGMLLVVLFLLRTVNRRTATVLPVLAGDGSVALAQLDPAMQGSARLRANLDRLQARLNELEVTAMSDRDTAGDEPPPVAPRSPHDLPARVALLMGKGQVLLNLQQADTALACFEEVVALDPTNAEAFVKKGAVLEKLGRLDEAIDCYDQAIALDTSMTMAYLCKGGVFNRLERYSEALQCYEQALRAQQESTLA